MPPTTPKRKARKPARKSTGSSTRKPASADAPPWEQEHPPKRPRGLTTAQKQRAKARARRAGRPYPNLVDNMAVAKQRSKPKRRSR